MRHLWLLVGLLTLIGSGAAQAASYMDFYGNVYDPIQNTYGGDSSYSGSNLEPGANLTNADLTDAKLWGAFLDNADLTDSDLTGADLYFADLIGANLTGAVLAYADLDFAELNGADLSFANLFETNLGAADLYGARLYSAQIDGAIDWEYASWSGARYSLNAVDNNGDPIADTIFPTDMDQAWRDAAGMVAVPEPTTVLLVGVGLIGLAMKKERF